jgi:hypothetical protein
MFYSVILVPRRRNTADYRDIPGLKLFSLPEP